MLLTDLFEQGGDLIVVGVINPDCDAFAAAAVDFRSGLAHRAGQRVGTLGDRTSSNVNGCPFRPQRQRCSLAHTAAGSRHHCDFACQLHFSSLLYCVNHLVPMPDRPAHHFAPHLGKSLDEFGQMQARLRQQATRRNFCRLQHRIRSRGRNRVPPHAHEAIGRWNHEHRQRNGQNRFGQHPIKQRTVSGSVILTTSSRICWARSLSFALTFAVCTRRRGVCSPRPRRRHPVADPTLCSGVPNMTYGKCHE